MIITIGLDVTTNYSGTWGSSIPLNNKCHHSENILTGTGVEDVKTGFLQKADAASPSEQCLWAPPLRKNCSHIRAFSPATAGSQTDGAHRDWQLLLTRAIMVHRNELTQMFILFKWITHYSFPLHISFFIATSVLNRQQTCWCEFQRSQTTFQTEKQRKNLDQPERGSAGEKGRGEEGAWRRMKSIHFWG